MGPERAEEAVPLRFWRERTVGLLREACEAAAAFTRASSRARFRSMGLGGASSRKAICDVRTFTGLPGVSPSSTVMALSQVLRAAGESGRM